MVTISFDIPNEKVQRVANAMCGIFPIPIDEESGIPLFTKNQWAKEAIRRFVIKTVGRWEKKIAIDEARNNTPEDDDLLT